MGLHLCYELRLPAESAEAAVVAQLSAARERALKLPFLAVSDIIRLTADDLAELPRLNGLAFTRLEDVPHITAIFSREELYARTLGVERFRCDGNDVYEAVHVPHDLTSVAYGFGVLVGPGSEPAALGAVQLRLPGGQASSWFWHCCCKTQYASAHGDDNLLLCHRALVDLLEAARSLGFELEVRDETGYWESRDPQHLVASVQRMNQLIAHFAGTFTDAARDVGHDSRSIQAEIFRHPDFERLEMGPTGRDT
ncbi:MAG: hypothetical protein ACT4P6_23340 [Gemmatimonadaceae bacterium]